MMTDNDRPAGISGSSYINRDLSWLAFNRRVLEEAQDATTPLLERLKFLSIVSSNLEEFMSVRVAGIMAQVKAGVSKRDFTGYTPQGLLKRVMKKAQKLMVKQYDTFRGVSDELAAHGIIVRRFEELSDEQKPALHTYYDKNVLPVLTPMAIDTSRPFPLIRSNHLYLSVVLRREGGDNEQQPHLAILQVPANIHRLIQAPVHQKKDKLHEFILLEQLIKAHIPALFTDYSPVAVDVFCLTRNADLNFNEEEAEDLLEEIEKELRLRRWGAPVRLEVEKDFHPYALEVITRELEIEDHIISIDGPIDLTYLSELAQSLPGFETLRDPRLEPMYPLEFQHTDDFFSLLRRRDVLVFHPYESFEAVNDFVKRAAHDPDVLAIKMTLYRVSVDSDIVRSLAAAAETGKQVTVVVELKARFDEERNIAWAKKLEQSGCHVVYGLIGLKTHAKMTLVVRQEDRALRTYVHISTGNYNNQTARFYTDIGLFTSSPPIGEDISLLFNEMTGFSAPRSWNVVSVAPTDLMPHIFRLIQREAENAAAGKPARIIAKFNSLSNKEMIDQLYAASRAGVKIELIVRGICCLRPGIPGVSDNITVRSIVDRFLEHSRVYYFEQGGEPQQWISSADWMTRNLTRRIELMCPIVDERLKQTVVNYLFLLLNDNVKARQLLTSGKYIRVENDDEPCRSQFVMQDKIVDWKQEQAGENIQMQPTIG